MNLNTPLWQLTVGEFMDLQEKYRKAETIEDRSKKDADASFVYGITGLADLLNCSKATAQKIKNSGVIDKAVCQFGRKITINADLALELIQKSRVKLR